MEDLQATTKSKKLLINFIMVYVVLFACGLFFLNKTPVVNNDEYWLGDAANELSKGTGYNVSVYPEFYQNIKTSKIIGFSLLQSVFVSAFGFNVFSLRILSYLSIFIAGWVMFLFAKKKSFINPEYMPFIFVLNPYIWHVGHVGRPEAAILLLAVCSIYFVFLGFNNYKTALILGLLFSVAYTIFILGVYISVFILIMLILKTIKKEITIKNFGIFLILVVVYATFFVGTQGWDNLLRTYTGEELKAANLFGSYPAAIKFYLSAIVINKMALPTAILVATVFFYWFFNVKKSFVFLKENIEILLYIIITASFLIFLRRTNMFYISLLIAGFYFLVFAIQITSVWFKYLLRFIVITNVLFVVFYTVIYPRREGVKFSAELKTQCILAPIQWRDQLPSSDSFVAMEDYKGVLKTRYMAFETYVNRHKIKYLLVDEFTQTQWYGTEIVKLAETKGKLIQVGSIGSLGSRDYEDIPYFLSLRKAYNLMKERPRYGWKLYSIKQ